MNIMEGMGAARFRSGRAGRGVVPPKAARGRSKKPIVIRDLMNS